MMSHREIRPEDAVDARSIDHVIAELREPVPVRAEWRVGLLRGIAMLPPPGATSEIVPVERRWQLRPGTAIAAGFACVLAGAALMALLLGRPARDTGGNAFTSLTATMPLPGEGGGRATVRFVYVAPYASRVALVGDFNAWNPAAMPMRRSADGRAWMIDVPLMPGRHVYAFVVDGDLA